MKVRSITKWVGACEHSIINWNLEFINTESLQSISLLRQSFEWTFPTTLPPSIWAEQRGLAVFPIIRANLLEYLIEASSILNLKFFASEYQLFLKMHQLPLMEAMNPWFFGYPHPEHCDYHYRMRMQLSNPLMLPSFFDYLPYQHYGMLPGNSSNIQPSCIETGILSRPSLL